MNPQLKSITPVIMKIDSSRRLLECQNVYTIITRGNSRRKKIKISEKFNVKPIETVSTWSSNAQSLSTRGFLRNVKPYNPPANLEEKLDDICEKIYGTSKLSEKLQDENKRCQLFLACYEAFKYKIPSSLLHTMTTIRAVKEFYATPIDTTVPYDTLKDMTDLPQNLHVIPNYTRFHPDTDAMFGGKSAFPKSSTIVTGLRYKEKYKGYKTETPWEDI